MTGRTIRTACVVGLTLALTGCGVRDSASERATLPPSGHDRGGTTFDFAACSERRFAAAFDPRKNVCRERFVYVFSDRVEDVLPNIPNAKSPWKHVTGTGVSECYHPRHPLTRAGIAKWFNAILDVYSETFGGVSSEGACDAYAAHFDSVLTAAWSDPFPKPEAELDAKQLAARRRGLFSDHVPFWELVYHGYLLYTPFRNIMNATANPDPRFQLKLAEYDGRPTFYVHSRFKTYVSDKMGARDLRAVTDEELADTVACVKRGADEYARRSRLQEAFMERHEKVAEGVFRTTFSTGAALVVNYTDKPVSVAGATVPAGDYVVTDGVR